MKLLLILLTLASSISAFAGSNVVIPKKEQLGLQAEVAQFVKTSTLRCTQTKGEDLGLSNKDLGAFIKGLAQDILAANIRVFLFQEPKNGEGYMQFSAVSQSELRNNYGEKVRIDEFGSAKVFFDKNSNYTKMRVFFNTEKYNESTGADSSTIIFDADCTLN